MLRKTTSPLGAWDRTARAEATIEPGRLLTSWRIVRRSQAEIDSGANAYDIEFHSDGREYLCPLFLFQPRTEVVAVR